MFFERPDPGSRALLVHVDTSDSDLASLDELKELVESASLRPVKCIVSNRKIPHPATFLGQGKVSEIAALVRRAHIDLVVFDAELTPSQERNLERQFGIRVIDRSDLILQIFSQRARTHEGKLQVELAQLAHASTRLIRGWTHLDRQRGGSGRGAGSASGLAGTGETQLEADQRMLDARTRRVVGRLEKVRRQRGQNRRARKRSDTKLVSLAGYTNAGKSTLFNRLCSTSVLEADQLFATLDPTLRKVSIPILGNIIVSDTVGFIRQLPHSLVDAFRATLEEVSSADLILHVVDESAEFRLERISEVESVLSEIGACNIPSLLVYNKVDVSGGQARIERDASGRPSKVWVSARMGIGFDLLRVAIAELLAENLVETTIEIQPHEGGLRSRLFALGAVINEQTDCSGVNHVQLRIDKRDLDRIRRRELVK